MPALSILMPVYNERRTLAEAIRRVLEADLPADDRELILVDDGSTDGTGELIQRTTWPDAVRVLRHDRNHGKGAALQTALRHARGTFTAIMDADLEYDPADLRKLLEPLVRGDAKVVFGVRGFESHSAFSFWYVLGNKLVTMVANVLFNSWLDDIMTCHKAMRTDVFQSLPLTARGFAIEPEITARVLLAGHRIYEVPITYLARGREEGKKLTALDGLRVVAMLLRCRLDGRGRRVAGGV